MHGTNNIQNDGSWLFMITGTKNIGKFLKKRWKIIFSKYRKNNKKRLFFRDYTGLYSLFPMKNQKPNKFLFVDYCVNINAYDWHQYGIKHISQQPENSKKKNLQKMIEDIKRNKLKRISDGQYVSIYELFEYISLLESQSFRGWSEECIRGYKTACISIKDKFNPQQRYDFYNTNANLIYSVKASNFEDAYNKYLKKNTSTGKSEIVIINSTTLERQTWIF